MNRKKISILIALVIMIVTTAFSASASTVVKETFQKTYHIDATDFSYQSCNDQENWETGSCAYLYGCAVVVPYGSNSLEDAVFRECDDITDVEKTDITVTFAPPRGNRYAVVTFIVQLKKRYDYDTYEWKEIISIPDDYRSGEELISLCADGYMLKGNLCFPAQSVCLDTFSTNLCDNPYSLYVLDYGYGFELDNTAHYCADRDEDLVCDETTSFTCSDSNANGVCDEDDTAIQGSSCVDENQNYVCDDVEGEGVFCRTTFDPVSVGSGENCITFPNSCFAEGSGYSSWNNGTCKPIYGDFCYSDSDCEPPCDGVTGQCKDPDNLGNRCFYSGECNPQYIQCSVDDDCPDSPCTGVDKACTSSNSCEYVGKCITQPTVSQDWWDKLWSAIFGFIAGIFS